jgi:hypothetical protein
MNRIVQIPTKGVQKMNTKKNRLGYIAIEMVITGALIMATGFFALLEFNINGGKAATKLESTMGMGDIDDGAMGPGDTGGDDGDTDADFWCLMGMGPCDGDTGDTGDGDSGLPERATGCLNY